MNCAPPPPHPCFATLFCNEESNSIPDSSNPSQQLGSFNSEVSVHVREPSACVVDNQIRTAALFVVSAAKLHVDPAAPGI